MKGDFTPDLRTLDKAIKLCSKGRRRVAIDGGAYFGNLTDRMRRFFKKTIVVEPVHSTFNFLSSKYEGDAKVELLNVALLDRPCKVSMCLPPKKVSKTANFAMVDEHGEVDGITIDSLKLEVCDLLKLDLEGADYLALLGARETLIRCRPVVMMEFNKERKRYSITKGDLAGLMERLDYRLEFEEAHNRVYRSL